MTTTVEEEVRVARHVRLNPHQVIFQFTRFFYELVGKRVDDYMENASWSLSDKNVAYRYMYSLVKGDGTEPRTESTRDLTFVEDAFYELCQKYVVGHSRFGGQLQGWYRERLALNS